MRIDFRNILSLNFRDDCPEISDKIIAFDPETLKRQPVRKEQVIRDFEVLGNRRAVKIVENIPDIDGILDPHSADRLLVTAHCEMQRISEEFQHGRRVAELLRPLLTSVREKVSERPIRIVDVGCGTGFVVRWLTANDHLGDDVELVGVDFNEPLIQEAKRLASAENLTCEFAVANAFRLEHPAAIYISTGILHHFRGDGLTLMLAQHRRKETLGFVHFDFHPSPIAPLGSWLFHAVRMREPLARHDGVLSAVRAHGSRDLLQAAKSGVPDFVSAIYGTRLWSLPIPRVFHALVEIKEGFLRAMGNRAWSLGVIE